MTDASTDASTGTDRDAGRARSASEAGMTGASTGAERLRGGGYPPAQAPAQSIAVLHVGMCKTYNGTAHAKPGEMPELGVQES